MLQLTAKAPPATPRRARGSSSLYAYAENWGLVVCALGGYDVMAFLCVKKAPSGPDSPPHAERQNLHKPTFNKMLQVFTVKPTEKTLQGETSLPDSRSSAPSRGPGPAPTGRPGQC